MSLESSLSLHLAAPRAHPSAWLNPLPKSFSINLRASFNAFSRSAPNFSQFHLIFLLVFSPFCSPPYSTWPLDLSFIIPKFSHLAEALRTRLKACMTAICRTSARLRPAILALITSRPWHVPVHKLYPAGMTSLQAIWPSHTYQTDTITTGVLIRACSAIFRAANSETTPCSFSSLLVNISNISDSSSGCKWQNHYKDCLNARSSTRQLK